MASSGILVAAVLIRQARRKEMRADAVVLSLVENEQMSKIKGDNKYVSANQGVELNRELEDRFEKNMVRHKGINWADVAARLETQPDKLWILSEMERTGGEPDVVGFDNNTGEFIFFDCSPESPKGRRSVCYDQAALDSRKEHKPKHSAIGMANEMGIRILTKEEYRHLQSFGPVDTKTSSWIETPVDIRTRGGALFGDWRYGHVFIYHNGAESYYAARGFRGSLSI
jgi:hypothetical protein